MSKGGVSAFTIQIGDLQAPEEPAVITQMEESTYRRHLRGTKMGNGTGTVGSGTAFLLSVADDKCHRAGPNGYPSIPFNRSHRPSRLHTKFQAQLVRKPYLVQS